MKKMTAVFLSALILAQTGAVNAQVYYEKETKNDIAGGVTHIFKDRYTDLGWQRINIITADLTSPYLSAEVLTHKDGLGKAATVLELAKQQNSVAAINTDFFARKDWSRASGTGVIIENGKIISTQTPTVDGAFLGITNENEAVFDYLKTTVTVTNPEGAKIAIKDINKYDSLAEPILYTSDFAKMTDGSVGGILEVVVTDGVVTEMRREQEGIEIPENGYVIRALPDFSPEILQILKVGDEVTLNIETSLDIQNIKTASGGGTLLIKDGQKHKITHNVAGNNPRTMAGVTKDGKTLYLVTVDGRKNNAAGMTLQGLQDLALELGLYHAINFDGGGSTTMTVKNPATNEIEVVNTPSDGGLRTVPTGFQIKSTAPKGEAKELVLKAKQEKAFVGSGIKIWAEYALDEYKNTTEIPEGEISWTSEHGYFKDGLFYPQSSGICEISAQVNGVVGKIQIDAKDTIEEIYTIPKSVYSTSPAFTIYGKDNEGTQIKINQGDTEISDFGKTREISFNGVKTTLYINEGNTDTFEGDNAKAQSYPSGVGATYKITDEDSVSGTKSGRLDFSFDSRRDVSQAAYIAFNTPKTKPQNAKYAGVWVYAPCENYQWLRLEGKTETGEIVRLTLDESMEFSGWQYKTVELPENLTEITRMYLVQNTKKGAVSSYILVDNLEFMTKDPEIKNEIAEIPENDETGEFSFAVSGGNIQKNTLFSLLYEQKLLSQIKNSGAEYHFSLGDIADKNFDTGENAGVMICANGKGITGYDSTQWEKLKNILAGNSKNVFIGLNTALKNLPNRQDEAFISTLEASSDQKNIYLFLPGVVNKTEKINGITYVTVSGLKYQNRDMLLDQTNYMRFARVYVKNGIVNISFEKVFD